MDRSRFRFGAVLLCVVAVALGVRLLEAARTYLVFDDTAHYIDIARMILGGRFAEAARHPYHPLFAALIAGAGTVIPDLARAATAVAVAAGGLATIPLALVWRRAAGGGMALLAALAFAIAPYPVHYAGAGQSESLYFLLFFTAVFFALASLRSGGARAPALCGLASGLAYLVRPEGAGVFAVLIFVLLARLPRGRDEPLARRLRPLAGCALVFVLLGAPYVAYKYETTGAFQLTGKKSIAKMLGFGEGKTQEPPPVGGTGRWKDRSPVVQATVVLNTLAGAMFGPYAALAILGILLRPRSRRRAGPERFLGGLIVFYLVMLLLLLHAYGYVSRRHAAPLAGLALGWSAMGWGVLFRGAGALVRRLRPRRRAGTASWLVPALVLGVFAAATLPKALKPQWRAETPLLDAARWLAGATGRDGSSPRVCTPYHWSDPRIPVYAGLPIDQPTILDLEGLLSYLDGTGADYLAVLPYRVARVCAQFKAILGHPRLERVFFAPYRDDSGRTVAIYRVLPPSGKG